MLIAGATNEHGQNLLLLGISEEDIEQIRSGEDISTTVDQMDNLGVIVFGGRGDDKDLRARLAELFDMPDAPPQ